MSFIELKGEITRVKVMPYTESILYQNRVGVGNDADKILFFAAGYKSPV
ncbi:hypothetical protein FLA_2420 [Filimonas lacunae]|nr:hypothetical protein FLA_2420 [Filimonas lacunae]